MIRVAYWVGVLIIILLQGCKKDDPMPTTNSVKITSVSPTTGLASHSSKDFVVEVDYSLASQSTATLMIGFNNGLASNTNVMLSGADKIISRGSGHQTFTVNTMVQDWNPTADFHVYVNISPNPLPSSWTPYVSDTFVLIPKN